MTEQKKPVPAPKAWRGKPRPGYEHYGELKEPVYKDSAGKRLGNWLMGLLTSWK